MGYPNSWMVYNGKPYENVYFMENPKQKWIIYDDLGVPP